MYPVGPGFTGFEILYVVKSDQISDPLFWTDKKILSSPSTVNDKFLNRSSDNEKSKIYVRLVVDKVNSVLKCIYKSIENKLFTFLLKFNNSLDN